MQACKLGRGTCRMIRYSSTTANNSELIVQQTGHVATIQLNRPKALNALNKDMCAELKILLSNWSNLQAEVPVGAFIMKGVGGKAFCAGGDVKSIYQEIIASSDEHLGTGKPGHLYSDFFRTEYEMNYMIGTSPIPQVSLWDGIVMGGGVGVSVLGEFRIATEKTMFAMPETAIGLFPDVGSSAWLPHLKEGLGAYIGLSGCRLNAADLLHSGIATHYITSDRLPELEAEIHRVVTDDVSCSSKSIKKVLMEFQGLCSRPDESKSALAPNEDAIVRCFSGVSSVEEIVCRLDAEAASGSAWAGKSVESLRKMSPTSLKITMAQLQQGKLLGLKGCLEMEFRIMMGCVRQKDFCEGIRAMLIDRDNAPKWSPSAVDQVTEEQVSSYFKTLGPYELNLPLKASS